MRFMIFVKATQTSETGAMPSQELIEAMGLHARSWRRQARYAALSRDNRHAAVTRGFSISID
jgi:hypothetical protein